jgi:hypothetical protein
MNCCKNQEISQENHTIPLKNGYVVHLIVKYCLVCCTRQIIEV